jgi:hypothetical protein
MMLNWLWVLRSGGLAAVVEGASNSLCGRPIVTIHLIASLKDVSFGSGGDVAPCYSSHGAPSARDFGSSVPPRMRLLTGLEPFILIVNCMYSSMFVEMFRLARVPRGLLRILKTVPHFQSERVEAFSVRDTLRLLRNHRKLQKQLFRLS